jgi:hypothetical protein
MWTFCHLETFCKPAVAMGERLMVDVDVIAFTTGTPVNIKMSV